MARYVDVIDLALPPRGAFDLLADFAGTPEWDPGVVRARRLDPGPIGCGSRFEVTVRFLGRELPLTYEIVTYEPPRRLVLRARSDSFESRDELHFTPRAGGTRVSYGRRRGSIRSTGLWFVIASARRRCTTRRKWRTP